MTQNALFFIPDISGFTEFVNNTAINHSKHIISELLEVLIDFNKLDLKLAEIEGDALFFYKVTEETNLWELNQQVEIMYKAFHTHLKRYEYERICQCGACSSAYNLSIKFIIHYGDIDFIKVKNIVKPYGSAVKKSHRLLKNEVPLNEYKLITQNVIDASKNENVFEEGTAMVGSYDFGEINYQYFTISQYKEELPYIPPIPEDTPKHKIYDRSEIIQIPILDLYEVISNFDYRLLWYKGIDRVDYEKRKVNRTGIKHQCLINNRAQHVQTITKNDIKNGQLVYGETTNNVPLVKKFSIYYVLSEVEKGQTKLNIEVFVDYYFLGNIVKPLLVKNLKKNIPENIKELILLIDSGFKITID